MVFGGGAALALFDPGGGAVGVVFAFPDGDTVFDFVDEEAAGVEGGSTMRRGDVDDDGEFADGEFANAVAGDGVGDVEAVFGFEEDSLSFFFG